MIQVQFQRNLIGLEDLLVGTGTVQQTRGNDLVTVTEINGSNLPYDGTRSMAQVINALTAQVDSLPVVVDSNGNLLTGLIDSSANVDLSATHAGRIWQKVVSGTQTNVYWGSVLMYEYNQTTGNLIGAGTAYIAADTVVTNAFIAADIVVTNAFQAADTAIITAYEAADAVVVAAYEAADTAHLVTAEAYTDAQIIASAANVDFLINQTEQATINASSNVTKTIAYTAGAWTPITVSSAFTLAFTFPAGKVCSMILAITNGGGFTITWPAGMLFPQGAAPALTTSGLDLVSVFQDANNTLYAAVVGNAFAT